MARFLRMILQEMTPTVNKKTGTFEKLLSSHIKRRNGSAHCSGFDADFAAAYLERTIPNATIQRYENHLAECTSCRITVAQLARSDETNVAPPATDKEPARRLGWIFGLLYGLATPRWALAALALLVAVISVPVIINKNVRNHSVAFIEEDAPAESNNAVPVELAKNTRPASPNVEGGQPSQVSTHASPQRTVVRAEEAGPSVAAGQPASGAVTGTESDKRTDREEASGAASKDEPKKTEEPATHVAERREAQPARKTSDDRTELGKIDSARALSVPEDKSKGGEVKTLKPGSAAADAKTEKERTAAVKPLGELTPRSSEAAAASDRGRSGISAPPPQPRDKDNKAVMTDEVPRVSEIGKTKPAKPEERRVSNKTFRLIGGVWTDKRYKPDKEIPVVPLVWDTDVYKEMLVKQAGLKAYFVGFKSDDRVVLIYKGAIYKLVPPDK